MSLKKTISLALYLIIYLIFLVRPTFAWLDCPYQKTNDPYPGSCALYTDTNNDSICDRSQAEPTIADQPAAVKSTDSSPFRPFFWSFFLTLASYFLHWYFVFKTRAGTKFNWLKPVVFYYFWNLILLITFLITALTSILWLLNLASPLTVSLHNQIGIVFIILSVVHILKHLPYFISRKLPQSN